MILLWGSPLDEPIAAVSAALSSAGHDFLLLDPRRVLETEVELTVDGETPRGWLALGDQRIELQALSGIYLRPADPALIPAVSRAGQGSPAHRHAIGVHEALRAYSELCDAVVINPLSSMASNSSKPYQARLIQAQGFATPETLLTTDPDAVRAFQRQHQDVIYKSVSGVRSIVGALDDAALRRLTSVQTCPTQFQRRIPGIDHRVHVIGERVFVTRVVSEAVDYRYSGRSGATLSMTATELEEADQARCRDLARALGLQVAGIDLRLTPAGTFVCFEVNPSPAFTFYAGGAEMAEQLAQLLSASSKTRASQAPATHAAVQRSSTPRGASGPAPVAPRKSRPAPPAHKSGRKRRHP